MPLFEKTRRGGGHLKERGVCSKILELEGAFKRDWAFNGINMVTGILTKQWIRGTRVYNKGMLQYVDIKVTLLYSLHFDDCVSEHMNLTNKNVRV